MCRGSGPGQVPRLYAVAMRRIPAKPATDQKSDSFVKKLEFCLDFEIVEAW